MCILYTCDQNDLKLGTVVVLHTGCKPTDFGFKRPLSLGLGLWAMVQGLSMVRESSPNCICRVHMHYSLQSVLIG